jgi:hypothetical protein
MPTSQIQALRDELEDLEARECCPTCGELTACRDLAPDVQRELAPDGGEPECAYDDPLDETERERLADLRDFRDEIPDWHSLIHEDDFEAYAQEYCADVCSIDTSVWPATCIDWKQAADELRSDYTSYEIDGVTFYGRD